MKISSYKCQLIVIIWPLIPCMQTTPGRCATLLAMVVTDVFIVPIHIAATIVDAPLHRIHLIMNVLYQTPPLTLPFIMTERRKL
jgi:hypothetical protein